MILLKNIYLFNIHTYRVYYEDVVLWHDEQQHEQQSMQLLLLKKRIHTIFNNSRRELLWR